MCTDNTTSCPVGQSGSNQSNASKGHKDSNNNSAQQNGDPPRNDRGSGGGSGGGSGNGRDDDKDDEEDQIVNDNISGQHCSYIAKIVELEHRVKELMGMVNRLKCINTNLATGWKFDKIKLKKQKRQIEKLSLMSISENVETRTEWTKCKIATYSTPNPSLSAPTPSLSAPTPDLVTPAAHNKQIPPSAVCSLIQSVCYITQYLFTVSSVTNVT